MSSEGVAPTDGRYGLVITELQALFSPLVIYLKDLC